MAPVSQIKVKKDYVPKALRREREGSPASTASGPTSKKKVAGQICPRCSQVIPHDQLESHMRIELLDPKWRDQKAKEVEWKRTKNLDDAGVAKVLSNISEFRTDIFDEKEGIDVREKVRLSAAVLCHLILANADLHFSFIATFSASPFQLKQLEEAALSRESRAWDGHTATARTLATAVISSLTPEERAKDALRRRGMLVEGEQVGVQVPESMLDSGRDDRWRERGPGQREEMPEWFRDPTQMAMGGAMPGMVPGMGMMGMPPSDMTAAAYYASLYAQQQDSK